MSAEPASPSLWRLEMRATLALAWPLIVTNLAQSLIQATDVILLGWAGAGTLAAGTLGVNVYLIFLIFGLGLVTAAAPLMAAEIGARRPSGPHPRAAAPPALPAPHRRRPP